MSAVTVPPVIARLLWAVQHGSPTDEMFDPDIYDDAERLGLVLWDDEWLYFTPLGEETAVAYFGERRFLALPSGETGPRGRRVMRP